MGYSPLGYAPNFFEQKGFPVVVSKERLILESIGSKYGKTAYQVALIWVIRQDGLVTIPKATKQEHIINNLHALDFYLQQEDLDQIEMHFPI